MMATPSPAYNMPGQGLGLPTPDERAIVRRVEARRIAMQGDMQQYRQRIDEVMRWINPPWDPASRRVDPRPELASAARQGTAVLHADLVGPTVTRWATLQAGAEQIFRVKPRHIAPPIDTGDQDKLQRDRKQYDIDRAAAQDQSTQMENVTQDWLDLNNFHRTSLWAAWSEEAFGKAIIKLGWDMAEMIPTAELLENPSQVYYAWTNRYGRRQMAWAIVADQMDPAEANARFNLNIPTDAYGNVESSWASVIDQSDVDYRPEQQQTINRMVWAEEYWELIRTPDPANPAKMIPSVGYAMIVAGRVVDSAHYAWMKEVPFRVWENEHILTYLHGKSTAEGMIPLNAAYDDMLDRQAQVIDFESGPRYIGLNMANAGDEVDIPDPFQLLPLREGEDIKQIDTRVDFFPTVQHAEELRQARYSVTGLTPIAWGMSPNAQTSGRAMAAEWRAVELVLISKLVNKTPEIRGMISSWWDYAEHFDASLKELSFGGKSNRDRYYKGRPYRRFDVLWQPLDIRDSSERTQEVIARYTADLIDPESALDMLGVANVDEIIARIESYMLNPVWKPLRYQQYLVLQQMQLGIRQQAAQVQMAEQQAQQAQQSGQVPPGGPGGPGAPPPGGPPGPSGQQEQSPPGGSVATNQPEQQPLAVDSQLRSFGTPQGGAQDRAIARFSTTPTAPPPARR